jgi:hypothetical protein
VKSDIAASKKMLVKEEKRKGLMLEIPNLLTILVYVGYFGSSCPTIRCEHRNTLGHIRQNSQPIKS